MPVGDIPILILVLLVDAAHESSSGWKNLVDEDEDGLLGRQLDSLADNIDELADGEICWDKVLLLVDGGDVAFLDLLADNLDGEKAGVSSGRRWVAWGVGVLVGKRFTATNEEAVTEVRARETNSPGCGQSTSDGFAQPRPCASRRGARP